MSATQRPSEPDASLQAAVDQGLTPAEWERILALLGRTPTWTELGLFSAMWSEHCSYKSSAIHLGRFPTEAPHVLQGPGENAGVIDVGDGVAVAFKMESHNHPSYIEPYQGAATGVGGILRDVFTMGARPIASLNALRFGRPEHPRTPYLVDGVVAGIGGYGNSIGVPTVGGDLSFDASYDGNCLVNAFTLGVLPADRIFLGFASGVGNPVLYVGAKTGRDGIHGATMASESFEEGSEAKRPTVQVGDPFTGKRLLEACQELMRSDLLVGIQDMGAAGLTSSAVEMAARAGNGMELDLDAVPRRAEGMTPWELLLSESQERMLLVSKPGAESEAAVRAVFAKWDLEACVVGRVTDTGRMVILSEGEVVADVSVPLLADEAPRYDRPRHPPADLEARWAALDAATTPVAADPSATLLQMLGSPELCSRRRLWQHYDHTVRVGTVAGPGGDAAVVRLGHGKKGLGLSVGCEQRLCWLDPRRGAALAVAETARNLACVGAKPLALTDCLNFGNPERPEIMWELSEAIDGISEAARALGAPIVSGNVSLYNETEGESIKPTPMIGMVGLIDDVTESVGSRFTAPGHRVVLLGPPAATFDGLAGSAYLHLTHDLVAGRPPAPDLTAEAALGDLLRHSTADGLLESAHDISSGGIATCLAEATAGDGAAASVGATVRLPAATDDRADTLLFGEDPGRVVVSITPVKLPHLAALARTAGIACTDLGETGGERLAIEGLVDVALADIESAREVGLDGLL
jgi:phosphoribosylformylglycinamidine synthase II